MAHERREMLAHCLLPVISSASMEHPLPSLNRLDTLARMICYEGKRTRKGVTVTRLERPDPPADDALSMVSTSTLPLRLDLADHSPTGFEWGYGGSGPAQLALALLADALGDEDRAIKLHQEFKREVVAVLPEREWQLSECDVKEAARRLAVATGDAWE